LIMSVQPDTSLRLVVGFVTSLTIGTVCGIASPFRVV
jgi:hypothetical protein